MATLTDMDAAEASGQTGAPAPAASSPTDPAAPREGPLTQADLRASGGLGSGFGFTPNKQEIWGSGPAASTKPTVSALDQMSAAEKPETAGGLKPGQVTGMGNVAGAAVRRGVAGWINTLSHPVDTLISQPLAVGAAALHDVLAPMFGAARFTPEDRAELLGSGEGPGEKIINKAADLSQRYLPKSMAFSRPEDVVATTPAQKLVETAGGGAVSGAPFGPIGAALGAAGAVGGRAAASQVPEHLQPATEMLTNLAIQAGAHPATRLAQTGGRAAVDAGKSAFGAASPGRPEAVIDPATGAPMSYSSGENAGAPIVAKPSDLSVTGQELAQRAGTTPAGLGSTIANAAPSPVPGMKPTTAQVVTEETGNPQIQAYQKKLQNESAAAQAAFDARHQANTLAVVNNLDDAAPQHVGEVAGNFLRAHLDALEAKERANNLAAETGALATRTAAGLESPTVTAPNAQETIGQGQRAKLTDAQQKDYEERQAAYRAMPGNLSVDMGPVGDAARQMLEKEPGPGGTLHPSEKKIYEDAADLFNGVVPFAKTRQFLSNLADAKRQVLKDAGRETRPDGRLKAFSEDVTDALAAAVDRGSTADAEAGVPAGDRLSDKIAPLSKWESATPPPPTTAPRPAVRMSNGMIFDPDKTGLPPVSSRAVQPDFSEPLQPLTPELRAQWQANNKEYAMYKDKWRYGTMGPVLRAGVRFLSHKMPDSAVGDTLFPAGPKGADAANDLIKAVGSPEAASGILGDYPALTLRNFAMRNGTFDLPRYEQWKLRYKPILDKFPDIAQRFETAADAQRAVEEGATRGREAVEAFENSAAAHYLPKQGGVAEPNRAIASLMTAAKSKNPLMDARDLMRRVGGDEAATAGLRRNAIDWLLTSSQMKSELGTSGALDTSTAKMRGILGTEAKPTPQARALAEILTPAQMQTVWTTADQLQQLARRYNAIKLAGSPTTAMDLIRSSLEKGGVSGIRHVLFMLLPFSAFGGGAEGLIAGAVGRGLDAVGESLLAAGIHTRAQLMQEAMLNPAFARAAAEAAAQDPRSPLVRLTQKRMAETLLGSAENVQEQNKRRQREGVFK